MRIAFLDTVGWDYDAETPYEQPMGGSQSALCYLAAELVKLGHDVTVMNGSKTDKVSLGVKFRHITQGGMPAIMNTFDVAVVLSAAIGRTLRREVGVTIPLVMWNHHTYAQQAIKDLILPSEQSAWNAIAFVAEDQRKHYLQIFDLNPAATKIMRNGVCPAFEALPATVPWFEPDAPPVLFYTSTPFRGLDVLLMAFPAIRKATGAKLRIFSSMAVYRLSDEKFETMYRQSALMDGVEYVGSLGQRQLAKELTGAAALAHPSTFAECNSIAAIEAMAVGAAVFTTNLGGQSETTGGLAEMIPPQSDKGRLAGTFAEMGIDGLERMKADPARAATERNRRIQYVHDHYLWKNRAKDWSDWLAEIGGRNSRPPELVATRDTNHSSRV